MIYVVINVISYAYPSIVEGAWSTLRVRFGI